MTPGLQSITSFSLEQHPDMYHQASHHLWLLICAEVEAMYATGSLKDDILPFVHKEDTNKPQKY